MTVEDIKRRVMRAMDAATVKHGPDSEIPGFRAAIEALPDRHLLSRLALEVRGPIEEVLSRVDEP